MTILVVDDEPMILRLLDKLLTDAGYRVLIAVVPEAALSVSRELPGPIDLLVTDLLMPGADGRAVGEAIQRERPDTRVLVMSAYADAAEPAMAAHPDWRFIAKPFHLSAFLEMVGPLVSEAGASLRMPAAR
jgi:DNA-binding NtrC family response regulator